MLRLMCITAHPDDEASNFGGTLRLHADRGVETSVICLTPGQAGSHRGGAKSDQELADMRREEFVAACEILKVKHAVVLDYPDGRLHRLESYHVACDIVRRIREFRPQVVLTFGPEGKNNLRTKLTYAPHDVTCDVVAFQSMQTTVRIVEYDSMLYFEYFASRHELFAPHISEFLVAFRASAMASGLAGRQTNHRGFNATVGVESEGASEIGGFIV